MAVKKKAQKQPPKPKARTTAKAHLPKKAAKKKATPRKSVKKSEPRKKLLLNKKSAARKTTRTGRPSRRSNQADRTADFEFPELNANSDVQSGDLQGLSDSEGADSESVTELTEEGNPLEAAAVRGVEEADNADEKEVHTHEVLEDDVPEEYLDKE